MYTHHSKRLKIDQVNVCVCIDSFVNKLRFHKSVRINFVVIFNALRESVTVLCFVVRYFMSILVLQSS